MDAVREPGNTPTPPGGRKHWARRALCGARLPHHTFDFGCGDGFGTDRRSSASYTNCATTWRRRLRAAARHPSEQNFLARPIPWYSRPLPQVPHFTACFDLPGDFSAGFLHSRLGMGSRLALSKKGSSLRGSSCMSGAPAGVRRGFRHPLAPRHDRPSADRRDQPSFPVHRTASMGRRAALVAALSVGVGGLRRALERWSSAGRGSGSLGMLGTGCPGSSRGRRGRPSQAWFEGGRRRGGYIDLHNFRARDWLPAVRAAGFVDADGKATKRIYDLRHTFATFAIHALVPSFIIARMMGTSEAMLRKHYGHLLPDTDDLVRERLNAWEAPDEPKAIGSAE